MVSVAERTAGGRQARSRAPRSSHGEWAPAADRRDPIDLLARRLVDEGGMSERDVTAMRARVTAQIEEAAARIAEELNSQYVLGYTPPRGPDGQYHSLRVRVPGSDDRVRARQGYVATPPRKRSNY